jgi:hypothetical protein
MIILRKNYTIKVNIWNIVGDKQITTTKSGEQLGGGGGA